jgi:hypothetical protein
MQADLKAERVTPASHALAADRLETVNVNLRSSSPPDRFDPTRFSGIGALNAAVANLETQVRVKEILGLVEGRKETAERVAALETVDPEKLNGPIVFDEFRAGDISHLLYIYHGLHHRVDRWLGGEAIPTEKIQALGRVMVGKLSHSNEIMPSPSVLAERNNSAIAKTQIWLDNPKMHETMDRLIPESNNDNQEDVWDFMDSLVSLNRVLGERSINLKIFIEQYVDKIGGQGFPFDIRNADWAKEAPVSVDELAEESSVQASATKGFIVEPLESRPKAVEQRNPDIRDRLGEYLDDILAKPQFSAPASGVTVNLIYRPIKTSVVKSLVEAHLIDLQTNKEGHPRFDPAAIAAILYLITQGKNLPSQLKKQVQGLAVEEYKKKLDKKKPS